MPDQPEYEDPFQAAERKVTILAMMQEVIERDTVILRQAALLGQEECDNLKGEHEGGELDDDEVQAIYDFLEFQRVTVAPMFAAFMKIAETGDLEATKVAYDRYMETTDDIMDGISDEAFLDPGAADEPEEDGRAQVLADERDDERPWGTDWTPEFG